MSYRTFADIFAAFEHLHVLVVGDVMIDAYIRGRVERISPEAPVQVLDVTAPRENRLGGAANVALNVRALGARVSLAAVMGTDAEGQVLRQLCQEAGIGTEALLATQRPTTVKTRVMAGAHHLLRIDSETTQNLSAEEEEQVFVAIKAQLASVDVLIFEDYDKGLLSPGLIARIVAECQQRVIPTVVDPKKRNFLSYKSVSLFKPNLKELREGLNLSVNPADLGSVWSGAEALAQVLGCQNTLITLSEYGMVWASGSVRHHSPAWRRNIADVSGAGDTVVTVAAMALALGLNPALITGLANLAGGLVCEEVGVVPIHKTKLLAEAEAKLASLL